MIKLVIADDHAIFRAGLRLLIDQHEDLVVVGEASDGIEALSIVDRARPDVVLVDLSMPRLNGVQTIESLRRTHPLTKTVALTMHDDPVYAASAIAAGASGYVTKSSVDLELIRAIRAVVEGKTHVTVELEPERLEQLNEKKKKSPVHAALSPRELSVLKLVAQGHTNRECAERIGVSVKSIETYRARLSDKIGLRRRSELVRYAIDCGLLDT